MLRMVRIEVEVSAIVDGSSVDVWSVLFLSWYPAWLYLDYDMEGWLVNDVQSPDTRWFLVLYAFSRNLYNQLEML
jgi:hypothetical protein